MISSALRRIGYKLMMFNSRCDGTPGAENLRVACFNIQLSLVKLFAHILEHLDSVDSMQYKRLWRRVGQRFSGINNELDDVLNMAEQMDKYCS